MFDKELGCFIPGYDPANPPGPIPAAISTRALWDTGASRSVISTALVSSLGLTGVGKRHVHHGLGDFSITNVNGQTWMSFRTLRSSSRVRSAGFGFDAARRVPSISPPACSRITPWAWPRVMRATHLYKSRWQVELFSKWIKQHLRIKAFYGTSENAVVTQI